MGNREPLDRGIPIRSGFAGMNPVLNIVDVTVARNSKRGRSGRVFLLSQNMVFCLREHGNQRVRNDFHARHLLLIRRLIDCLREFQNVLKHFKLHIRNLILLLVVGPLLNQGSHIVIDNERPDVSLADLKQLLAGCR